MGGGNYSVKSRSLRAEALNFAAAYKAPDTVFKQNIERKAHPSMLPKGVVMRECATSKEHPNVTAEIIALDLTASMGSLPAEIIANGLPTIMGEQIEMGVDPALLFLGITDHVYNPTPLQVGQFEASDEANDMWLTRTYIEGGGGGNAGESYMLAWYFAVHHTKIERFDKEGVKGFLFSIGDEPVLPSIPASAITAIFGNNFGEKSLYLSADLYKEACKKFHVYHINIHHSAGAVAAQKGWDDLLGERSLKVDKVSDVAKLIVKTIASFHGTVYEAKEDEVKKTSATSTTASAVKPDEEYL